MRAILLAALLVASPAVAQVACPAGPPPPGCPTTSPGFNAATICWAHDGKATTGANITLTGFKAYYGLNGSLTSSSAVNDPAARFTTLTGLAAGTYTFAMAAVAAAGESAKSCTVTKTVSDPPPLPTPPTMISVSSTRIDSDSWTCRDSSGAILTRHERQDKAQEACTNFAIANLGQSYVMQPSGYRIVARR